MLGMNRQQQEAAFAFKQREEARVREASAAKSKIEAKARKAASDAEYEELAAEVLAWEEAGFTWLKAGEGMFGPNYDFQNELKRLGMRYAESRILPYENLNDMGVNVYAGVRAIFLHGLIALVLSLIAVALGFFNWIVLIASVAYVVWRFRVRKGWLLKQRADARNLRAEITDAHDLRALS